MEKLTTLINQIVILYKIINDDIINEQVKKDHIIIFNEKFRELYEYSLKSNLYWEFCFAHVYTSNFKQITENFRTNTPGSSILNLIAFEIIKYSDETYPWHINGTVIHIASIVNPYNDDLIRSNNKKKVKYLANIQKIKKKKFQRIRKSKSSNKYNKHPHIFPNDYSYYIFKTLQKRVRFKHSDYSFIYRKMRSESLIHPYLRESDFREWLSKTFSISLDKLKTLKKCVTTQKNEAFYQAIKKVNADFMHKRKSKR